MSRIPIKEKDYLENDLEIRGQKYYLASFVSPEDAITNTQAFIFSRFIAQFGQEMTDMFDKVEQWSKEHGCYSIIHDCVSGMKDKYDFLFSDDAMQDKYRIFCSENENELATKYHQEHDFQTNIRGLKVRGVYGTLEESKEHAKILQEKFPRHPATFTGEVGVWAPWSPHEDDVDKVEYLGTELNTLMSKYNDRNDKRDKEFVNRFAENQKKLALEKKEETKEETKEESKEETKESSK